MCQAVGHKEKNTNNVLTLPTINAGAYLSHFPTRQLCSPLYQEKCLARSRHLNNTQLLGIFIEEKVVQILKSTRYK